MSKRTFQSKKRNDVRRHRKPIMLIAAEGKNKTERQYFAAFQSQHGKYIIDFVNVGKTTDPEGMLKATENAWKDKELSKRNGDIAYVVLDADCDVEKIKLIKELQKRTSQAKFIVSNPCFEVWFLLHFRFSTKAYKSGREPKKEMTKYIPGYVESMDVSDILSLKLEKALENVEKLKEFYDEIDIEWGGEDCNPMTDVADIVIKIYLPKNNS